jgi:hypothetical protein
MSAVRHRQVECDNVLENLVQLAFGRLLMQVTGVNDRSAMIVVNVRVPRAERSQHEADA